MTPSLALTWLPIVPLCLAVLSALLAGQGRALTHGIAALGMAGSTLMAIWIAGHVVSTGQVLFGGHATWLDLGNFSLGVGTYADPMAAIMAVIVTLLATLVLVFNAWYMHDDALAARFPWQFCLFVAAMLGVVLSDNLFLSFVCWELVGLGSYLLIGFWFAKPAVSEDPFYQQHKGKDARGVLEHRLSPAHAQLKAFVMNRVGDFGFLLGIGALLALAVQVTGGKAGEPLTWVQLQQLASTVQSGAATGSFLGLSGQSLLVLAALGIFCGAIGKSAQFPLHPWLPDAMQGPTTASSIIHAATMVAAGVFLVARCEFLFPPSALLVVGWIGGITALLAASMACVQWDLKAVLAYSTVSQLGLMFVALGAGLEAGGTAAGIAHLFTHAMFKCLLFLCAAAVIHACGGCQDLARLGGLRRRMPVTAAVSLLATLAILGAPLFSGFYSKDAVLAAALGHAQTVGGLAYGPFLLACAASLLTAAYMLRWWLRMFVGEERDHEITHHAHDPAPSAKVVLLVLAPFTLSLPWTLGHWLDHALAAPSSSAHQSVHQQAMYVALGLLVVGASIGWWLFGRAGATTAASLAQGLAPLHRAASGLWGFERLYDLVFTRGLGMAAGKLAATLDLGSAARLARLEPSESKAQKLESSTMPSLDGLVDGLGHACGQVGRAGSWFHAGNLSTYIAYAAVLGTIVLLFGLLR